MKRLIVLCAIDWVSNLYTYYKVPPLLDRNYSLPNDFSDGQECRHGPEDHHAPSG